MKNLLLLLLLANILYFRWGMFGPQTEPSGIEIVAEADLGPPLTVSRQATEESIASVGEVVVWLLVL